SKFKESNGKDKDNSVIYFDFIEYVDIYKKQVNKIKKIDHIDYLLINNANTPIVDNLANIKKISNNNSKDEQNTLLVEVKIDVNKNIDGQDDDKDDNKDNVQDDDKDDKDKDDKNKDDQYQDHKNKDNQDKDIYNYIMYTFDNLS